MTENIIITIGRQFGSGGHEIGNRLAERLSIPLYDHNLIRMAAKELKITPEEAEKVDESETETEEKWYAGDTEIALTDLSSAYSDLSGMSAEKILDTAAKSTGDAAISVTVKWEDDTETTVSFTVYDSSFHLAEINGEARKLVNKRDVEKLVEDMTALLKK